MHLSRLPLKENKNRINKRKKYDRTENQLPKIYLILNDVQKNKEWKRKVNIKGWRKKNGTGESGDGREGRMTRLLIGKGRRDITGEMRYMKC